MPGGSVGEKLATWLRQGPVEQRRIMIAAAHESERRQEDGRLALLELLAPKEHMRPVPAKQVHLHLAAAELGAPLEHGLDRRQHRLGAAPAPRPELFPALGQVLVEPVAHAPAFLVGSLPLFVVNVDNRREDEVARLDHVAEVGELGSGRSVLIKTAEVLRKEARADMGRGLKTLQWRGAHHPHRHLDTGADSRVGAAAKLR